VISGYERAWSTRRARALSPAPPDGDCRTGPIWSTSSRARTRRCWSCRATGAPRSTNLSSMASARVRRRLPVFRSNFASQRRLRRSRPRSPFLPGRDGRCRSGDRTPPLGSETRASPMASSGHRPTAQRRFRVMAGSEVRASSSQRQPDPAHPPPELVTRSPGRHPRRPGGSACVSVGSRRPPSGEGRTAPMSTGSKWVQPATRSRS